MTDLLLRWSRDAAAPTDVPQPTPAVRALLLDAIKAAGAALKAAGGAFKISRALFQGAFTALAAIYAHCPDLLPAVMAHGIVGVADTDIAPSATIALKEARMSEIVRAALELRGEPAALSQAVRLVKGWSSATAPQESGARAFVDDTAYPLLRPILRRYGDMILRSAALEVVKETEKRRPLLKTQRVSSDLAVACDQDSVFPPLQVFTDVDAELKSELGRDAMRKAEHADQIVRACARVVATTMELKVAQAAARTLSLLLCSRGAVDVSSGAINFALRKAR